MNAKLNPPQPEPSLDSLEYWNGLKEGVLSLQRCTQCREWQFPALERCRHCGSALAMEPISGRGSIYSFFINHRAAAPGLDNLLPYAIALVAPEEDPRLRIPGRVVGAAMDEIRIGKRVRAEIVDLAGGDWKIPVFRLCS